MLQCHTNRVVAGAVYDCNYTLSLSLPLLFFLPFALAGSPFFHSLAELSPHCFAPFLCVRVICRCQSRPPMSSASFSHTDEQPPPPSPTAHALTPSRPTAASAATPAPDHPHSSHVSLTAQGQLQSTSAASASNGLSPSLLRSTSHPRTLASATTSVAQSHHAPSHAHRADTGTHSGHCESHRGHDPYSRGGGGALALGLKHRAASGSAASRVSVVDTNRRKEK